MLRFAVLAAFVAIAIAPTPVDSSLAAPTGCAAAAGTAPVVAPRFVRNIATGETGWFASPGLVDLNGDGRLEIVAPFYSTFVYDAKGRLLGKGTATKGRVYAPGVVADLDGDKVPEIVVGGNEGTVAAYELRAGRLRLEPGWPASTCSGGQCPEARGMAAADLDGDGRIETVVTTTNTSSTGSQVFVFDAKGSLYRPKGAPATAWPRFNTLSGKGNDADFNGAGNHGYGAYGENVGIGNLDDDPQLEIVVTFDNHQINVFNHDGTSVLASPWFRNRDSRHSGRRLGWGQFIRWLSPVVEDRHYHQHVGPWPHPRTAMWLQWTASPPSIADLDRDGRNEVIGLPNAELKEPYETQAYAFMVLDGAHKGGVRSARRHAGFVTLPLSGKPAVRPDGDWYPPSGIPAPTIVDIAGSPRPEIVASVPDGFVYAVGPDRQAAVALRLREGLCEDVRLGGRRRRPQPRRHARARLRHLRPGAGVGPARGALRRGQEAVRHPAPAPGEERERHRRSRGPVDRRPRPGRAPGDRPDDVRPRDRRLQRPGVGHELPAVADRTRQSAAQRRRPGRRPLTAGFAIS